MNTPNPLVPQGTKPSRVEPTFYFKVLMILTVHVVVIGGCLLAGCKDTKETSSTSTTPDTTAAATNPDTLPPLPTPASISNNTAANPPQNPAATTQPPPMTPAAPPIQPPPVAPPAIAPPAATGATEYVIASGDTLGAIAKKNGLALKVLMDANAGVNPKKLQIGQKIQIPAGAGAVASTAGAAAAPDAAVASGEATIYVVKSGDTLSKIAKLNHTTVKKLMALNDLKTTSIKVAQKLKVPAAKPETAPPVTTTVPPMQPNPVPAPPVATSN